MTPSAEFYNANVGLVHTIARRGHKRLVSANVGIDYEDVFQEMSLVFVKAMNGFDESKGFKFSTYFFMAAYHRLNAWAGDIIEERLKHGVVSIEELSESNHEEFSLDEILLADHDTPEAHYRVKQLLEHIVRSLSPLAGLILTWSIAPPPEIMDAVRKAQLQAEFARSKGYDARCMVKVSPRYVANFLQMVSDASGFELERALKEIDRLRYTDVKQYIGA